MRLSKPHAINVVETRYWVCSVVRFIALAMIIGGVTMPPNMARACWRPSTNASKMGIGSLRPKKGTAVSLFAINGRLGRKKKA